MQEGIQSKYQAGDIVQARISGMNFWILERVEDGFGERSYKMLVLSVPREFVKCKSWTKNQVPDIHTHMLTENAAEDIDASDISRKVGNVAVIDMQIDRSFGKTFLNAFPKLRQYYEGREYFQ